MHRATSWRSVCSSVLGIAVVIALPAAGWAHGIVGKRWFPSTVTVEDPFVSDEASVVVDHIRGPEGLETELELEITKRLSPDLAIGFGGAYRIIRPRGEAGETEEHHHGESAGTAYGFSNPEFSLRYQFIRDPMRELAATAALSIEAGGVGARRVEAPSGTTFAPALQIGKGFGDLPDWADWLKPVAVTGSVGFNLLTHRTEENQHSFAWGATVMYSIPYLQSFVKDVGIPWPFKRLFPVVEFNGETLIAGPERGKSTAFVNPGLIWAGKYLQLAVEAQFPLNDTSGRQVGILGMVHFFLDDISPNIFTWTPFHGVLGPQRLP